MDITAPIQPPEIKRRRRGFLLRILGFVFAASMVVFVAVGGAGALGLGKVSKDLPDYEVLAKSEPPVMTRIHANDGNLIAEFARERRIYVPFSAILLSCLRRNREQKSAERNDRGVSRGDPI